MHEIQELVSALFSKDADYAYESLGRLEALSASSNVVYEHFDEFLEMLDDENSYVRTRGFIMIVSNARWDEDCKVEKNIDSILKILCDPKPIAARQSIKRTPDLASCKPNLKPNILRTLKRALNTSRPENMQNLVQRDTSLAIERINSFPWPGWREGGAMNQQTQPAQRIHHFYISVVKSLFQHPEHGIVLVDEPIRVKEAAQYGLSPIILHGITVAGLPIRWMTFSSADDLRPLDEILLEGWRTTESLRGLPDVLRINRHLAAAAPALAEEMAKIGVRVDVAAPKDQSLPGSMRSAQDICVYLPRFYCRKEDGCLSLPALRRGALEESGHYLGDGFRSYIGRKAADAVDEWLALPVLEPPKTGAVSRIDWTPGPWLHSWEASLPPERPRYFTRDESDKYSLLLAGDVASSTWARPDGIMVVHEYDNLFECVRDLVECWPNSPMEIARSAGITLRELQWFMAEKAPLDERKRVALMKLLGIRYDERMDMFLEVGPYTLVARKQITLEGTCENLTRGWDASPCEIVPASGEADPSWRYFLLNAFGEPPSFVMAPRGETITNRLPDVLVNYSGIAYVTRSLYKDVVATCARASREPAANVREMRKFAERHKEHWEDAEWWPE